MPRAFYAMTPYQYALSARGYFMRTDRQQEGLRKIWHLLYNANAKKGKGINSLQRLRQYWPLGIDDIESAIISREDMKARFANALKNSKARNLVQKLSNGNSEA